MMIIIIIINSGKYWAMIGPKLSGPNGVRIAEGPLQ